MNRRSGGARQKMWALLLRAEKPLSLDTLMKKAGAAAKSVWAYMGGLERHGYVTRHEDGWALQKPTGPIAPSYNVNEGTLRDWNTHPVMPAAALRAVFKSHGGSVRQFCIALGLAPTSSNRVAQMLRGERRVSVTVDMAVRRLSDENYQPDMVVDGADTPGQKRRADASARRTAYIKERRAEGATFERIALELGMTKSNLSKWIARNMSDDDRDQ